MEALFLYGLVGWLELLVLFGVINKIISRNYPNKHWWLVALLAALFSLGYAFNIFIIEGEGSNSFGGSFSEDVQLYLIVFTFFSIVFCLLFLAIMSFVNNRQKPRTK